jgi:DNA-binding HxlR family transcriptional regulator
MKALRRDYGCPVEFSLDCLGGKWKTVILANLKGGPMRYADLRRRVRPMADKVLNERLLELQATGLVAKHPVSGIYSLSDRGRTLGPVLQALYDWGQANAQEMDVRFPRLQKTG